MTKLNLHLLSILAILAGPADEASAQVPGSTPHTYPKCLKLGLTDQACHRQIVKAGGITRSSLGSSRTIVPRNFRGWNERERWYRKYVEYCKRARVRFLPIEDVIHHYPDFPVYVPYYLVYP